MGSLRVSLRRPDPSHPWGFRIAGGTDLSAPVTVRKVNPNGKAARSGVSVGDVVLDIGGDSTVRMTHQQAQQAIIRCGNELDLQLFRGPLSALPISVDPMAASPGLYRSNRGIQLNTGNQNQSWRSPGASSSSMEIPRASPLSPTSAMKQPSAMNRLERAMGEPGKPLPMGYSPTKPISTSFNPMLTPGFSASSAPSSGYSPVMAPGAGFNASHSPGAGYSPSMAPGPGYSPSMAPGPGYSPSHAPSSGYSPNKAPSSGYSPNKAPSSGYSPNKAPSSGYSPNKAPSSVYSPNKAPSSGYSPNKSPNRNAMGGNTPKRAQAGGTRRGQSQRHQAGSRGPMDRDPICDSCHSLIRGPFIVALERCFCPEHFRCDQCGIRMENCGFVEEGGQLYCETDYARFLAPRCGKCGLPVVERIVTALRQSWHPACFCCNACKRQLAGSEPGPGEASFRVGDDNLPYCEADWAKLFQAKCEGCGYSIDEMDQFIEALGKNFHSACFCCAACKCSLDSKPFVSRDGKAFCKAHARAAAIY